jgi:ribonuclease HII
MNASDYLAVEERYRKGGETIVYVDEVGYGCLFGEVVAAAVVLKNGFHNDEIKDSKKIAPKKRERLAKLIEQNCYYAYGMISVEEINKQNNILRSAHRAMQQAIEKLEVKPRVVFLDGKNKIKGFHLRQFAVPNGDEIIFGISCASIIAKVFRDKYIVSYAENNLYNKYGIAKNKGYGTREHLDAIRKHGLTDLHRYFAKVKDKKEKVKHFGKTEWS